MNEGVRDFHFNVNVRGNKGSKAQMANNEDSFLRAMEIQDRKRAIKELEQIEEEKIRAAQAPVEAPAPVEEVAEVVVAEAEAPVSETPSVEPIKPSVKPASGGVPGPTPRSDFTSEEKALMLKRAKAHAAEVRARNK